MSYQIFNYVNCNENILLYPLSLLQDKNFWKNDISANVVNDQ